MHSNNSTSMLGMIAYTELFAVLIHVGSNYTFSVNFESSLQELKLNFRKVCAINTTSSQSEAVSQELHFVTRNTAKHLAPNEP